MKKEIPLAICFIMALVFILANFFTGNDTLGAVKAALDQWYSIVIAWVTLLGIINLTQVHGRNVSLKKEGWFYSLWLIICMFSMLLVSVFVFKGTQSAGWKFMFNNLLSPMQATVFSTLVFYIGSSAYRSFRVRSLEAGILLVVAAIMMLGRVALGSLILGGNQAFAKMAQWMLDCPNTAGMRGITIGAYLGGVATALRIALGLERGYLGGGE